MFLHEMVPCKNYGPEYPYAQNGKNYVHPGLVQQVYMYAPCLFGLVVPVTAADLFLPSAGVLVSYGSCGKADYESAYADSQNKPLPSEMPAVAVGSLFLVMMVGVFLVQSKAFLTGLVGCQILLFQCLAHYIRTQSRYRCNYEKQSHDHKRLLRKHSEHHKCFVPG